MVADSADRRRVLSLPKYGAGAASTRHRLLQFLPYLAAHGIDVDVMPFFDDGHMARVAQGKGASISATAAAFARRVRAIRAAKAYDAVWVYLELLPWLPGAMERALLPEVPIIYDCDDAIFHQYDAHSCKIVRRLLGTKLEPVLRRAAVVTAGNEYLARYAAQYARDVTIVPTVVDTDEWMPSPHTPPRKPVIGWIGSPSTWSYVEPLLPVLRAAAERQGATISVIGAGPRAAGLTGVDARDWDAAREVAEVQAMDVGIMPLPNAAWARGKCGFKLIQYMACGVPVVASPVGVNAEIVDDGVNGYLATTPDEWAAALDRLLSDPARRAAFGATGRERAVAHYSLAAQAPRVLAAWRQAMAR